MVQCTICLENIDNIKHKNIITYECNHSFHRKCIQDWEAGTCPNCRAEIPLVSSISKLKNIKKCTNITFNCCGNSQVMTILCCFICIIFMVIFVSILSSNFMEICGKDVYISKCDITINNCFYNRTLIQECI